MLKKTKSARRLRGRGHSFAIIASKYNTRYVEAMLREARAELKKAGADKVKVVRVPGAFEIPAVAANLAFNADPAPAAIICLGVILRGATTHAEHIGEAVSNAFAQLQILSGVPVVHEVLLLENAEQARERCLVRKFNRGREAARTAIEMAAVMKHL